MKIEEYIDTLPSDIISGEQIQLTVNSMQSIFDLVDLGSDDVFYHLGCGDGRGVRMAAEYGVKRSVGIDIDMTRIETDAEEKSAVEFVHGDILDADLSDATVILFWFTDAGVVDKMMPKFKNLQDGCRIVTIWSPLPECLPSKVDFPYMVNETPFPPAKSVRDQLLAVFGVDCIDFVTAWEYSERYIRAIEYPEAQNDRFLTILQSVTIWINARNMGITCTEEMPESIRTYVGILRTFFGIEVEHLLEPPASKK